MHVFRKGALRAGRQALLALVGAGVLGAGLSFSAIAAAPMLVGATAQPTSPAGVAHPQRVLDKPLKFSQALSQLGAATIDSINGKSTVRAHSELAADPDAWIDQTGHLYFVDTESAITAEQAAKLAANDPTALAAPNPTTASGAAILPADAFNLQSRPGSNHTIYLDFLGTVVTNTGWNTGSYGPTINAVAYDTDGNPGVFSDSERNNIISIWKRVAEDYAPFDVNVTTKDLGQGAITRTDANDQTYGTQAVITSMTDSLASPTGPSYPNSVGCGCGGIAYVGVFNIASNHDYYQPAFILAQNLAGGTYPKYIAEAVSHEVGHTFGLHHDGNTNTGSGYDQGHGIWAPIMGASYYRPLTQWSAGEYQYANNQEDDLAIIAGGGAPVVADDHGDTIGGATAVSAGTQITTGVISTRNDVDVFKFVAASGTFTASAVPASTSPNLDIKLELLNSVGAVITSNSPDTLASGTDYDTGITGLSASISQPIVAGTYYLRVDGVGMGDNITGYSDYASLGQYTMTSVAPDPNTPNIASYSPTAGFVGDTITVTGSNFNGTTDVLVGSVAANFTVVSDTQLTFTIPAGSASGIISVTNAAGTSVGAGRLTVYKGTVSFTAAIYLESGSTVFEPGNTLLAVLNSPSPFSVVATYQWNRDGVPIDGATSGKRTLTNDDVGHTLTVEITASATDYQPFTDVSNPTVTITGGVFSTTGTLAITGSLTVGSTVSASGISFSPTPDTVTYNWYLDNGTLLKPNSSTLLLTNLAAGDNVYVTATASKTNFTSLTKTSATSAMITGGTFTAATQLDLTGGTTIGATLTARASGFSPTPSLVIYKWYLDDGTLLASSSTDATSSVTYLITNQVAGHKVYYTATATRLGFTDSTVTSQQTALIGGGTILAPGGAPTISGTARVGQTLTANFGAFSPTPETVVVKWYSLRDGLLQSGASTTFVVPNSAAGSTIYVDVIANKQFYNETLIESAQTAMVTGGTFRITGFAITGTAAVGETLTAAATSFSPAPISTAIQWYRDGTLLTNIAGATYPITSVDLGHKLSAKLSISGAGFDDASATSNQTVAVVPGTISNATLTILGYTSVGLQLTTQVTGASVTPESYAYKWYRGAKAISTSAAYIPTNDDAGFVLSVVVVASKPGYNSATLTASTAVPIDGGAFTVTQPVITGSFRLGEPLTATITGWAPTPESVTYTWFRGEFVLQVSDSNVYYPTFDDLGHSLTVLAMGKHAYFADDGLYSADTIPIGGGKLSVSATGLTETPIVGGQLTITTSPPAPISGTTIGVVWRRDGVVIASAANKLSYDMLPGDVGSLITARVTFSAPFYDDEVFNLAANAVVAPGSQNPGAVEIAGNALLGSNLFAAASAFNPGATLTYVWLRDGVAIANAKGVSYLLTASDVGHQISVRVIATQTGFSTIQLDSAAIGPIQGGPAKITTVSITGTLKVGKVLGIKTVGVTPGAVLTYQWMRNGAAINGATAKTYKLARADKSKLISVMITLKAANYTDGSKLVKLSKKIG